MTELLEKTAAALRARGFEADCVADGAAAARLVLDEAADVAVVGWGGSETVKALGLREKLTAAGKTIADHTSACDVFLLSANALTADGRIVNIDGNGNRVAASISGPGRVIYLIGRNKIVDGGVDAAIARIKRCACPPNCRRLGKKTPCAATGVCADCDSPDRICKVTAIFDRRPTGISARCILIDEDLGY